MPFLKSNLRRGLSFPGLDIPGSLEGGWLEVETVPDHPILQELISAGQVTVLEQAPKETIADYVRAYDELKSEAESTIANLRGEIVSLKARIEELEAE